MLRAYGALDLGEAVIASSLALIGAFVLTTQLRTSLALLRSVGNVFVVASLLAPSDFGLNLVG